VTPSGIEPATFRFVAQCLNHCSTLNKGNYVINTTNLMQLHFHFHFIDVQCLDMFRALLAHPQEALHGHRIVDYCVLKFIIIHAVQIVAPLPSRSSLPIYRDQLTSATGTYKNLQHSLFLSHPTQYNLTEHIARTYTYSTV
jgi:hypothetical protein